MPVDPSVLAAMTAAVEASPENAALRLHLASLLLEAELPNDALTHATAVLSRQPDNLEGLLVAARAAEAIGETARAQSYRRLHAALGGETPSSPVERPRGIPPEEMLPDDEMSNVRNWSLQMPPPGETPQSQTPERLGNFASDHVSETDAKSFAEEKFLGEDPSVTLKDVAGMDAVKRRLNVAFLGPMKNPEIRLMYGKSLRGGLLLYGPPGCGKTFIARATAGELGARFISVGLSDVMDMYIGQSERNLHELFELARRSRPCVLFFDEIDALGRKRSLRRESHTRDIVNQLLSEMDSMASDNEGLFILAATNHPWDVDAALRRPGRLDRTLLVLPPDTPAREAILRSQGKGRPIEGVDYGWLASKTEDYSGADLVHLADSAAENAMEESLNTGRVRSINMNDFKRAMKEVRPSVRPWFDTARNYAMFSNEGGVYDDLVEYLRARKMV